MASAQSAVTWISQPVIFRGEFLLEMEEKDGANDLVSLSSSLCKSREASSDEASGLSTTRDISWIFAQGQMTARSGSSSTMNRSSTSPDASATEASQATR